MELEFYNKHIDHKILKVLWQILNLHTHMALMHIYLRGGVSMYNHVQSHTVLGITQL